MDPSSSSSDQAPLRSWDPEALPHPFSCLIVGSRRSGKSHAIQYLYQNYWHNKFDVVATMCTTDISHQYSEYIPGRLHFDRLKPEVITALMAEQARRISSGEPPLRILMIIDDCSDDFERNDRAVQSLYTRGRHYHISVVFATQACQLAGTVWRSNSDIVLIGKQYGSRGRELIVENFLLGLAEDEDYSDAHSTEKKFDRSLVRKYTRDHNFIAVDSFNGEDFASTVLQWRAAE